MDRWYFPSWCGDFRIEALGEAPARCALTVTDPTPAELDRLDKFLGTARRKGWVRKAAGISPVGESRLELDVPVGVAGRVFLGKAASQHLTVLRSSAGILCAERTDGTSCSSSSPEEEKAEAAVSVRRPTLDAPSPVPGPEVRASEVLRQFSTPAQWEAFVREGVLRCRGGLSGRLYEVAHRHHPLAIERGKCAWDVKDACIMYAYDWSVPPAEEVLMLKLVLEHAEDWIRNRSGCGCRSSPPIFYNPFMPASAQALDGKIDGALLADLGLVGKVLGIGPRSGAS